MGVMRTPSARSSQSMDSDHSGDEDTHRYVLHIIEAVKIYNLHVYAYGCSFKLECTCILTE